MLLYHVIGSSPASRNPGMKWEKLGRIFVPEGRADWMRTHAALPTPVHLSGDRYRIYCAGRDLEGHSHVGYFEIRMREPGEILEFTEQPVLRAGDLGAFDDCGVMNACIVVDGPRTLLYYVGMSRAVTVPFRSFTGLAVSLDGGRSFQRFSRGPILPPDDVDPFLTAASFVRRDGDAWRMWYTSGVCWEQAEQPKHYYHIKQAASEDGIVWSKDSEPAIDFEDSHYAIARPWVLQNGGHWQMWYSYRGDAYRIGYAESADGRHWTRSDGQAGIAPSASGWDSEMVCYAAVFTHGGERFMLYNGNSYGSTGIGLARAVG